MSDTRTCGLCSTPATWEINGGVRVIADNNGTEVWRGQLWQVWACEQHKRSAEDFALYERGGYGITAVAT